MSYTLIEVVWVGIPIPFTATNIHAEEMYVTNNVVLFEIVSSNLQTYWEEIQFTKLCKLVGILYNFEKKGSSLYTFQMPSAAADQRLS